MSENKNFMWTHLVHLGANMWNEVGNTRGREHRSTPQGFTELHFDRELWDAHMLELRQAGVNTLIIDVAEAMRYDSHPELGVKNSWTPDEMRAEVARLRALGFEVIPKLNFSACHDVWLGDYSRMLSTPIYYQVCKDLIEEVCEVFRPKHFHIGMDEETFSNQRNNDYAVVRQFDLWWKDFYYLVDIVERCGARAWIWSDYMWDHPEEFFQKMPKSVVQCGWYYWDYNGDINALPENRQKMLRCFDEMDQHGYDQVPAGSVWAQADNLQCLTHYCTEHISSEHLLGLMQTTWERIDRDWMHVHKTAVDSFVEAKKWLEEHNA